MEIVKGKVIGVKGKTVCYIPENVRIEGGLLRWDAFKFFTPDASTEDNSGFKYFLVPAGEVSLERDPDLDKEIYIIAREVGLECVEILEGAEPPTIKIGLEGDVFLSALIPSESSESVKVFYKEVVV